MLIQTVQEDGRREPLDSTQGRSGEQVLSIGPIGRDFPALKTACSLAWSSCESEVIKILPPNPFRSSSSRSLSGVGLLVNTKSAELLGISVAVKCLRFYRERCSE